MGKRRIWELDFLRGFAIIMMVFDHFMYDLANIDSYFSNFHQIDNPFFNWINTLAENYWVWSVRGVGHILFVSIFLLVSGISFTFSKSNLKRSIKMMIVALLISVVTYLIEELTGANTFIVFGIIHMFALATFLTYLFRKIWDNDFFIFTIGLAIIITGFIIEFWDFHYISTIHLDDVFGIIIGTKAYGADYFGIIPNLGVIMIGTVIGNLFYKNKMSLVPQVKIKDNNLVMLAGKYSLWVFVLHQIVLMAFIYLVGFIFGFSM